MRERDDLTETQEASQVLGSRRTPAVILSPSRDQRYTRGRLARSSSLYSAELARFETLSTSRPASLQLSSRAYGLKCSGLPMTRDHPSFCPVHSRSRATKE